jgi:hypothetical protein
MSSIEIRRLICILASTQIGRFIFNQQQADELEGLDSQAYLDQFYENPRDILAKTIKSEVQKVLQPLTERINPVIETVTNQQTQEKWNKAATDLFAQHTDAPEFKEDMKQYIAERGLMKSDNPAQVFQDAYMYARGLRYAPPTPVDPKALLQDPNFLNDNIFNNPEIVNAILQKQMQTINSQQIPRGITGNTPGQPAAMPQTKPKTLNEAHSLFEGMFNRGLA